MQPSQNNNQPEVRNHGWDLKYMKRHQELHRPEQWIAYHGIATSSDTVSLQIYKAFMVGSISLVFQTFRPALLSWQCGFDFHQFPHCRYFNSNVGPEPWLNEAA